MRIIANAPASSRLPSSCWVRRADAHIRVAFSHGYKSLPCRPQYCHNRTCVNNIQNSTCPTLQSPFHMLNLRKPVYYCHFRQLQLNVLMNEAFLWIRSLPKRVVIDRYDQTHTVIRRTTSASCGTGYDGRLLQTACCYSAVCTVCWCFIRQHTCRNPMFVLV